jgi:hypothetical protein
MIGFLHALVVEVLPDLSEYVVVPGLLEIGHDDVLGIGVGLGAGQAELLRRPPAEELVAAGVRLESELLVMGEPLLETFLALVESRHISLSIQMKGKAGQTKGGPGGAWRIGYRDFPFWSNRRTVAGRL